MGYPNISHDNNMIQNHIMLAMAQLLKLQKTVIFMLHYSHMIVT